MLSSPSSLSLLGEISKKCALKKPFLFQVLMVCIRSACNNFRQKSSTIRPDCPQCLAAGRCLEHFLDFANDHADWRDAREQSLLVGSLVGRHERCSLVQLVQ